MRKIPMLCVRARGTGVVPHIDEHGNMTRRARHVGREMHTHVDGEMVIGAPLAAGELVPDTAFYRRRINQGSLELVPEPAAAPPDPEEAPVVTIDPLGEPAPTPDEAPKEIA